MRVLLTKVGSEGENVIIFAGSENLSKGSADFER